MSRFESPASGAAHFRPRELANSRLAYDLITSPTATHPPDLEREAAFDTLLEDATVLLLGLATAAQSFTIQRRLMEDIGTFPLDVPCRRLQTVSAAIVRRLDAALAVCGSPLDLAERRTVSVVAAADDAMVDALHPGRWATETLPGQIAAAVAAALATDRDARLMAVPPLVRGAGAGVALYVLAGVMAQEATR
jgi:hypothetical protein